MDGTTAQLYRASSLKSEHPIRGCAVPRSMMKALDRSRLKLTLPFPGFMQGAGMNRSEAIKDRKRFR